MHSDYPFDITKFTPVTEAATGPLILVVRNDLGVKTLRRTARSHQEGAGQDQVRPGRRRRQLARHGNRAAEGAHRRQDHDRAVSRRGGCAQQSARRPHRRDVRRHAGDGGAGQGRQGDAACGDRLQAIVPAAQRADHPGVGLGFPDQRLVWRARAARHAGCRSCRSCATRSPRRSPTRPRSSRSPIRAWSRAAPARRMGEVHGAGEGVLREGRSRTPALANRSSLRQHDMAGLSSPASPNDQPDRPSSGSPTSL